MATSRDLDKRLQALERTLLMRQPKLIFCWTRSLATRVEKALEARGIADLYRTVVITFPNEQAELAWEASVRKDDPKEAARLDMLLEGRVPG
jgi:hypothetical protein